MKLIITASIRKKEFDKNLTAIMKDLEYGDYDEYNL